jgi:hypothetical protein
MELPAFCADMKVGENGLDQRKEDSFRNSNKQLTANSQKLLFTKGAEQVSLQRPQLIAKS